MKKTIFFLFFLGIAGFASAQTSDIKNANTVTITKHTSTSKKARTKKSAAQTVELDNRKEYMENGQKATFTGHEASPTNAEQFQSLRDTATKRKKQ